jgi:signal transduction histidine kinase
MTSPLRKRLFAFSASVIALAVLIGWSAATALRDVADLRRRFTSAQFESFHIAGQLQSSVLSLNTGLLTYEISGADLDLRKFQENARTLDTWIDVQRDLLKTEGEKRALGAISAEFKRYMAVARTIFNEHARRTRPVKERLEKLGIASQKLLVMGVRLSDAHRRALGDFLEESQRSLLRLEALLGLGCAGLLAALGWGIRVFFRETIAPLRTQLVEARRLAQRQEKLASLGLLAAGVAHEIRNPLTALKARAFTLRKKLGSHGSAQEDAAIIDDEIDRLDRIVGDFLCFARPRDPELADVEPHILLNEACEFFATELAKNAIELVIESDEESSVIRADLDQIRQVLFNLIRNAAESIGRNGQIALRVRSDRLSIQGGKPCEVIILEVQDTGAGMPAEVQERLFDPFFTTKPAGTGLGLSIALRILERHGGTLRFQTVQGRGTTFGIVLPRSSGSLAR